MNDDDEPFPPQDHELPPRFLSPAEVAGMFGRTTRTIRNWVKSGQLRKKRIGRSVFFSEADILSLLNDGEKNTIPDQ